MSFSDRLKHAWSAFSKVDAPQQLFAGETVSFGRPPDRRFRINGGERTIIASIYTRLAIDFAQVDILHIKTNEDGQYSDTMNSGLQKCLTLSPNLDQAARHFRQDMVQALFDKGVVAVVPVETTLNPSMTGSYEIKQLRVGYITEWYPHHVKVSCYDQRDGKRKEFVISKDLCAIVENPLYDVMNEPNSTLQRLVRKLALLDGIDEQTGSGKLDIIMQLPYTIKTEARREEAEKRRKDIEVQLTGSKYGVAYVDSTERITQLNRPAENNLLAQIQKLEAQLYSQLGLTEEVFTGTAGDDVMLNYFNRTIEPLLTAFTEEFTRKFLTSTAITQGQRIRFFRDPFRLVTMTELATIGDRLTRNEIASSNEIRSFVGLRPSKQPGADELRNKNLPTEKSVGGSSEGGSGATRADVEELIEEALQRNNKT